MIYEGSVTEYTGNCNCWKILCWLLINSADPYFVTNFQPEKTRNSLAVTKPTVYKYFTRKMIERTQKHNIFLNFVSFVSDISPSCDF